MQNSQFNQNSDEDSNNGQPMMWVSGLAVLILCGVLFYFNKASHGKPSDQPGPAATQSAPGVPAEFNTLIGRWMRPDGGYTLEIQKILEGGKMEATYLNPRPIHIAQAQATLEEGKTKVYVELQDQGYPGCYYQLVYFPGNDLLVGTYFQTAIQQTYEVVFQRLNP